MNLPQLELFKLPSPKRRGSNKLQVVAVVGIKKERSNTKTINEGNLKNG